MSGDVVKCPLCPLCGSEPPFISASMHQAWCPNESCEVLCWVPWDTAAENLADRHEVEIIETHHDG